MSTSPGPYIYIPALVAWDCVLRRCSNNLIESYSIAACSCQQGLARPRSKWCSLSLGCLSLTPLGAAPILPFRILMAMLDSEIVFEEYPIPTRRCESRTESSLRRRLPVCCLGHHLLASTGNLAFAHCHELPSGPISPSVLGSACSSLWSDCTTGLTKCFSRANKRSNVDIASILVLCLA